MTAHVPPRFSWLAHELSVWHVPLSDKLMRAVQLAEVGKPLQDAEVETPKLGASEVLVRVAACGICHSDAHYRGGISPVAHLPLTLGHEVAGRVEAVGEEVTHVSPHDRVYVHYLVSCGHCDFCLPRSRAILRSEGK